MKKVFIMAIAVAAMTLASCNNGKTNAPKANADSDTTESVATDSATTAAAPATADQLIDQLNEKVKAKDDKGCLLYTSPSPRDPKTSRMPSSA